MDEGEMDDAENVQDSVSEDDSDDDSDRKGTFKCTLYYKRKNISTLYPF